MTVPEVIIIVAIGVGIGILIDQIQKHHDTSTVNNEESEQQSVDDILGELPREHAKKTKSYDVDSEEELQKVWEELTEGK